MSQKPEHTHWSEVPKLMCSQIHNVPSKKYTEAWSPEVEATTIGSTEAKSSLNCKLFLSPAQPLTGTMPSFLQSPLKVAGLAAALPPLSPPKGGSGR